MSNTHHILLTGPEKAKDLLVLAHGAGGPMDHPFFEFLTAVLSEQGVVVLRFEFPYMTKFRLTGKKAPPNPAPVLMDCYREIIHAYRPEGRLFIGGKSMGGRIASMIADEVDAAGVICLGYPFHPPGKPEKQRTEHLLTMKTPVLIVQGERDPFGNHQEVPGYNLPQSIQIEWSPDGDHSLKPRKKSGRTEEGNLTAAVQAIVQFMT